MNNNKAADTEPPLSLRELRVGDLEIRRHEAAPPAPITAVFDLSAETDETPEIALEQTGDGRWRVNVSLSHSRSPRIERAAPQPVRVSKRRLTAGLSRMKPEELAPSIPVDRDRVAIRPRLTDAARVGRTGHVRHVGNRNQTSVRRDDGESLLIDPAVGRQIEPRELGTRALA